MNRPVACNERQDVNTGTGTSVDRRDFLRSLIGMSAFALLPRLPRERQLRVSIASSVRSESSRELRDGVTLGLAESARAATLFNRQGPVLAASDADVTIAALDNAATRALAEKSYNEKRVLLNCGARDDSLRRELCSPYVFHVEASSAMYQSASKLAAPGSRIVLWSPQLDKYGASQLNDRFRAGYSTPMSPAAWAGWFAVKVIWESMLRSRSDDPSAIAAYLSSESTQFDGHKGAPLSFRRWDHQLRQPLYALDNASAKSGGARDIPDIGRSSLPARELLDQIGDTAPMTKCSRS